MTKYKLVSSKYVSWVLYVMFRLEKHCLLKHFAFLKNVFYWYVNFVLRVTCFFFYELLIGGVQFLKQGPAYKKGPDPNKGSKQQ